MAAGGSNIFCQELIDTFLDNLWDDKPTLDSCSVVCKSWSHRARRLLFHTMRSIPDKPHHIYSDLDVPDWDGFAQAFAAMPTLAAFVEVLEITGSALSGNIEWYCHREFEVDSDGEDGEGTAWGTNYTLLGLLTLHTMVRPLPHLKHVTLRNIVLRSAPLPTGDPIPLKSLSLDWSGTFDGGDVMDIFYMFSPEDVTLNVFSVPPENEVIAVPPTVQRRLTATKWSIAGQPDTSSILCALLDTPSSHINSLQVEFNGDEEIILFIKLLKSIGPSLKWLRLDALGGAWDAAINVTMTPILRRILDQSKEVWDRNATLAPCIGLEYLELSITVGWTCESEMFPQIIQLLLTRPSSVREVKLAIEFISFIPDRLEKLPWTDFSLSLSGRGGIEKVVLSLGIIQGRRGIQVEQDVKHRFVAAITALLSSLGDRLEVQLTGR